VQLLLEFHYLLLELGQALAKRRQRTEDRGGLEPVERWDCRIPGYLDAGLDRLRDAGLRRRNHPFAEADMIRHPDLPRQDHVVFDHTAAGNTHLRRQQRPPANPDAVGNLHQIVDLGAGADAGLADGGTIDGGVGADLDVVFDDDVRALGNFRWVPSAWRANPNPSLPTTAPSCRITRSPITTPSRIDTCDRTTQSTPMRTPGPMATFG